MFMKCNTVVAKILGLGSITAQCSCSPTNNFLFHCCCICLPDCDVRQFGLKCLQMKNFVHVIIDTPEVTCVCMPLHGKSACMGVSC